MKISKSKNIDDYIAGFPKDVKNRLQQIRATIQKAAPQAEEAMGYGVPAFKLNGNAFAYFAAFKNHIGFYPAPRGVEAFKKELAAYKGGKGTVQFPLDKPVPFGLIAKMVKFRVQENLKKAAKKKK